MTAIRSIPIVYRVHSLTRSAPAYNRCHASNHPRSGTRRRNRRTGTDGTTHQDTGVRRTTVSNERGVYTIPLLPPGAYKVEAQKTGFRRRCCKRQTRPKGR
ncbi:MAG: carboxypeptidase regulatory-like domain-containing protein [Acidobacteria bacterium]|nr:carboxypeptidase regulatory-like domain-containing protein [Acidobacteriota bacterium]